MPQASAISDTDNFRVDSPDPIVLSVNAQERLRAKSTSPVTTTAHVMTCAVMVTKLNKYSNYMLLVANGAVKVLVAMCAIWLWLQGAQVPFKTSP
jgi:hypothetical protein